MLECSPFFVYAMAILEIITGADNPILLKESEPVSKIDKETAKLVRNMKETLLKEGGLGLAAPQVGKHIRLILVAIQKGKEVGKDFAVVPMVNPEIIEFSEETCVGEEGCLSLPGQYLNVVRPSKITVGYLDEKSNKQILVLEDLNARIVQHEVDHLDGILITDRT
jgi:peptide deformylase